MHETPRILELCAGAVRTRVKGLDQVSGGVAALDTARDFTVPAVLKSWIDYVIRPGFTFRHAPGWPAMLENERATLIVVSRDTYAAGGFSEAADLVTPVLRQAFGFMGIHDADVVRAGGSIAFNLGKVCLEDHLAKYEGTIATAAKK